MTPPHALKNLATELEGSTPSDIRTLGFDYNPAGQITERTDTGGSFAFAGHTDQTSIYDHNALNPIIDITETGAVARTLTPVWTAGTLTSDGERSFGYDAETAHVDSRTGVEVPSCPPPAATRRVCG